MRKSTKIVIGRKDVADFEKLELFGIVVKIDSGAYTSSFHCNQIKKTMAGRLCAATYSIQAMNNTMIKSLCFTNLKSGM